jgi:hypothetical protein
VRSHSHRCCAGPLTLLDTTTEAPTDCGTFVELPSGDITVRYCSGGAKGIGGLGPNLTAASAMEVAPRYVCPVPVWLSDHEYAVLRAACAQMLPASEGNPGAEEAGVADYIDGFLGAFSFDPPRIWAGGPTSGEFNGPVVGLQERYREGLDALGADFTEVDGREQRRRLREDEDFCALLWEHCCEGMYGAPEYGGNRNTVGWEYIDYEGDVQPRGYSDAEVSQP